MASIPLATWNDWLWAEVFDDDTGDAQPVSIIHVDDSLFARAATRGGLEFAPAEARATFLKAFPDRLQIQRWLVGSVSPGVALLPLLILCCLAASEAADSDENDYRSRMRDLMHWHDRIINCEGLPRLWARLAAQTRHRSVPTRPLLLPDPRHRVQIGHAIELTFPSRNDIRRLLAELGAGGFDLDAPRAVLEWLTPIVARGRFSSSFNETFESFRHAWLNAERALAHHRFWSGWKLATQTLRQVEETSPFEIVSDEWGHRHLVAPPDDEPFDLERALRSRALPGSLSTAATRSHVIPLREAEWGRLRWTGSTNAGVTPDALLIRERAFGSRVAQLGLSPVTGADGWGLTFKVGAVIGERQGQNLDRDRLIEASATAITRVDGGILCRPGLPFFIDVRGYVVNVSLEGPLSSSIKVERLETSRWRLTPTVPFEGEVSLVVEPSNGTTNLVRTLRLRRSALTPAFRTVAPQQLIEMDSPPTSNWPADADRAPANAELPVIADESNPPAMGLLDLIEFLAIRTAPMPLAGIIALLDHVVGEDGPSGWDVLRSLADAGLIRTFRARGWRGRTVMAAPPRGVLLRIARRWGLALEGVFNETAVHRLETAAQRNGLELWRRPGVSAWSPETLVVLAEGEDQLRQLASQLELPLGYLRETLAGAAALLGEPVTAPRSPAARRPASLNGRHAPINFLDSDRPNQSPVWEVLHGTYAHVWRSREEAVLDAYLSVGERPFTITDGILSAKDARLPTPVARWIRLASGRAGGPLIDGTYGFAVDGRIEHVLRGFAPGLIVRDAVAVRRKVRSRTALIPRARPPLIAVRTAEGPRIRELWRAIRDGS